MRKCANHGSSPSSPLTTLASRDAISLSFASFSASGSFAICSADSMRTSRNASVVASLTLTLEPKSNGLPATHSSS